MTPIVTGTKPPPPLADYQSYEEMLEELERIELAEEDNENLESDWHRLCMTLLIESVHYRLRHRTDYYVGGNMFLYFNKEVATKRNFLGPDFFYVAEGVQLDPPRKYWVTWREFRNPDVIIEL